MKTPHGDLKDGVTFQPEPRRDNKIRAENIVNVLKAGGGSWQEDRAFIASQLDEAQREAVDGRFSYRLGFAAAREKAVKICFCFQPQTNPKECGCPGCRFAERIRKMEA